MDWLKRILVQKWIGRLITIALASLGGVLVSLGVEQAVVDSWTAATNELLVGLLPILIALLLDWVQHRVALHTEPPK